MVQFRRGGGGSSGGEPSLITTIVFKAIIIFIVGALFIQFAIFAYFPDLWEEGVVASSLSGTTDSSNNHDMIQKNKLSYTGGSRREQMANARINAHVGMENAKKAMEKSAQQMLLKGHDHYHENQQPESNDQQEEEEKEEEVKQKENKMNNNNANDNAMTIQDHNKLGVLPNNLGPFVPYLPAHTPIKNGDELMKDVYDGKPTIAGISHLITKFLHELHDQFVQFGKENPVKSIRDKVVIDYIELCKRTLLKFDAKYRGKSIFPIRNDDSIFMSLAAYREHLLSQTLKEAFGHAANPSKLFIGVVVQNCFGIDYTCRTGVEVVGKDAKGRAKTKVSDKPPDINGIEDFCGPKSDYKKYCDSGQVRVLYVNETESLGPTTARYFASKLWGGETYFVQVDSHLQFAPDWDEKYIADMKLANSYPKVVLSAYPPGFSTNVGSTPGAKLCRCEFSDHDVEHRIIRINAGGSYKFNAPYPTQIPFIAAGFFFTGAEFLVDVPFDPLLPWCFMGEEIALSMRAWTNGYDIYAPRMNNIAHQYRPGRMGLPKYWESVGRTFNRPGAGFNTRLQDKTIERIKNMVGYPESTTEQVQARQEDEVLHELEYYSLGKVRTREEYLKLTNIDVVNKKCKSMPWCTKGTLK